MKKIIFLSLILALTTMGISCKSATSGENAGNSIPGKQRTSDKKKIQVAILFDTSSSMDGLIEQAKSRIWNIVNTLTTLKFNGTMPEIEIAIYEYGNDGIHTEANDYIRQVTPLTTDLDLISEKLFALRTNGGLEYCGAVISKAVNELKWGNDESDMKLIYIAGNEPFTQGRISYKDAVQKAVSRNIYINTIHCGNSEDGISGKWYDGAERGKGKYFNINHNARVRYIKTPYDDAISRCNERLNSTYIGYGQTGRERILNQKRQDENARSISYENYTERAVSKTSSVYNNSSWDLVDKVKEDRDFLNKINNNDLPEEYRNKSKDEIEKMIKEKEAERLSITKEISDLSKKRQEYIDLHSKNTETRDDLGNAINESIYEFAGLKGYEVVKF